MRSTALCGESSGLVPSEVPGQDRDIRWHTLLTWLPLILKALVELISLAVWGGSLDLDQLVATEWAHSNENYLLPCNWLG